MVFPGITICNLNMIRLSQAADLYSGPKSVFGNSQENTDYYQTYSGMNLPATGNGSSTVDNVNSLNQQILSSINSLSDDVRSAKGYEFEDLIKYCSWGGIVCNRGYVC